MKLAITGSTRRDSFAVPPEKITIPGLDNSDNISPYQKKRIARAQKLTPDHPFVDSIRRHGVLMAIKAVKISAEEIVCVDGTQRIVAARLVNKTGGGPDGNKLLISCDVPLTDIERDEFLQIMMIGNAHRTDSLDDMEARIAQARHCYDVLKWDVETIAETMNAAKSTVKNWLNASDMAPSVKQALADKRIKPSAALELARMPAEKQAKAIERVRDKPKASVRELRAAASNDGFTPPSRKELRAALAYLKTLHTAHADDAMVVLSWVLGESPRPGWLKIADDSAQAG